MSFLNVFLDREELLIIVLKSNHKIVLKNSKKDGNN